MFCQYMYIWSLLIVCCHVVSVTGACLHLHHKSLMWPDCLGTYSSKDKLVFCGLNWLIQSVWNIITVFIVRNKVIKRFKLHLSDDLSRPCHRNILDQLLWFLLFQYFKLKSQTDRNCDFKEIIEVWWRHFDKITCSLSVLVLSFVFYFHFYDISLFCFSHWVGIKSYWVLSHSFAWWEILEMKIINLLSLYQIFGCLDCRKYLKYG